MSARLPRSCERAFHRCEFDGRVILETPMPERVLPPEAAPEAPRSNGQGCRVIRTARAKTNVFGITVNHRTIGVVPVDLERGVPVAAGGISRRG